MSYKCPYCLFMFSQEQAIVEHRHEGITTYNCPNPAVIEEGSERKICGKRLPLNFLESESIVIALTGAAGVGKTYYYLALLDQLKNNRALHQLGIQGDIVGSQEDKRKLQSFFEDVKYKKQLIKTASIESAIKSVIHLTITKRDRTKHVYLSFFDNPGEKFTDIDHMIDNFSNVYKADGLLFLFEPKQVEKLQMSILKHNPYLEDEEETDDFYTVLNNVIQLIKHVRNPNNSNPNNVTANISNTRSKWEMAKIKFANLKGWERGSSKVKIPFALAISKFDQLKKLIHVSIPFDESQLETMCISNDKFNDDLVNAISNEIEELITGKPDGEARIKNLLNSNMRHYAYFGVKSVEVDERGQPIDLKPQGVLLPLIWLLSKLQLY